MSTISKPQQVNADWQSVLIWFGANHRRVEAALPIFIVSAMHLWLAMLLWLSPVPPTGITSLRLITEVLGANGTAALMVVASLLALPIAITNGDHVRHNIRQRRAKVLLKVSALTPQQVLLFWGGYGSLLAIMQGAYLDGTTFPGAAYHIAGDQFIYIAIAFMHFGSILVRIARIWVIARL